ncbi:hypothetical protein GGH96_002865 [Coemansia sp. RSA 1972]|nr:hypothetical protein GGH96_002865 [Coemansia sp. RSA 1972]
MESFLQNHLLYLLCRLLGALASEVLAVVDVVSNWWHAGICIVLSLLPKAHTSYAVTRPSAGFHPGVLVTGTSSGIGHDTAVALAAYGYTVFAGVRTWEDGARVEADFIESISSEKIARNPWVRRTSRAQRQAERHAQPVLNSASDLSDDESSGSGSARSRRALRKTLRQRDRRGLANGSTHRKPQRTAVNGSTHLNSQRMAVNGCTHVKSQRTAANGTAHRKSQCAGRDGTMAGAIIPVILDVASSDSVDQAYERVANELRQRRIPLAAVVNNAGVTAFGPMDISAPAFIDNCMEVNFRGPVRVAQRFMPLLRASSGRIVNISSIMSWLIGPGFGVYCASKAALSAASRAWHYELANSGISVSVLEPGVTRTALWAKLESQLEFHHARLNGVRPAHRNGAAAAPSALPGDEAVASASPPRSTIGDNASHIDDSDNHNHNDNDDARALYSPMIRRIKTSNELTPVFALPTRHAVNATVHALTSHYPKTTYRVGWDARLISLATCVVSEEVVEWLCRVIGIVSES